MRVKKGSCLKWGKKHGNRKRRCIRRSKRGFHGYSKMHRRSRRTRRGAKRRY